MTYCSECIHDELKEMGYLVCYFCDRNMVDSRVKIDEPCCESRELIDDNGIVLCIRCGVVDSYNFASTYVDFHENRYRMKKVSVYNRKYHIQNVINGICSRFVIQISKKDMDKICSVFYEIDKILPRINNGRKRIISISFILRQLFEMMNLPAKGYIPLSKSRKTLLSYKEYWDNVLSLIGDRINSIIS